MEGWKVRPDCGVCHGDFTGSECKRLIENDDPRLTPNQLCVLGLAETLLRNRENGRDNNMRHAWECIDAALSNDAPVYGGYKQNILNEAFRTADDILRDPKNEVNLKEAIEAMAFKNYEGFFRAMANGEPFTPELIDQTRKNVGALITTIDEVEDFPKKYDGVISGLMAEQMVQWLSLYTRDPNNVILPSPPRQGHNDMRAFNHDGYIPRENGIIRIETKRYNRKMGRSRPRYDKSTVVVVLQDILDKTRSRHGSKNGASRRDNFLIDYVKVDLSGRESPAKHKVLQAASGFLMQHIERNNPLAA